MYHKFVAHFMKKNKEYFKCPTTFWHFADNIQQLPVYSVPVPAVRPGLSATGGSSEGHSQGGPQAYASRYAPLTERFH